MNKSVLTRITKNRLYQFIFLSTIAVLCFYTMVYFSIIRPRLTKLKNENNTTQSVENNANQPKTANPISPESTSSSNQQTSPSTSSSNNNQQNPSKTSKNAPATTAPTPNTSSPTQAPVCNESLKVAYTNKYNSDLSYSESYHDSEMNRIAMASAGHGGYDSSYRIEEQAKETTRYNSEVAGINADYYSKLATINC